MRTPLHFALGSLLLVSSLAGAEQPPGDAGSFEPARFVRGNVPGLPPLAAAGGMTVLELSIAASGIVTEATVLMDAPPYAEGLAKEAKSWRFRAASEDGRGVPTKVLVVGVYRPPVLVGGGVPDPERTRDPSPEVPYPTETALPSYPPTALYEGVALVEVAIDADGVVNDATILSPPEGFDELALETAERFSFRPARRDGTAVSSRALLVFGFAQPVTPGRPRR